MRCAIPWILVLWGLPCIALAEGVEAPAGSAGGAVVPPALDLRLDSAQLPPTAAPPLPRAIDPVPEAPPSALPPPAHERGLSFGVEVKPRGSADSRSIVGQHDERGLQDDIERLIDHSTLGLRGTYRF